MAEPHPSLQLAGGGGDKTLTAVSYPRPSLEGGLGKRPTAELGPQLCHKQVKGFSVSALRLSPPPGLC